MQNSISLQQAVSTLKAGGLVAVPTETVYGLAADSTNPLAVASIFAAKRRPSFNPLILHVSSIAAMEKLTLRVPPLAYAVAERFWPGPLTLVLPKAQTVLDLVTGGLPHVAVRLPRHPLMHDLLAELPFPLAAPSANPSTSISPTRPEDISNELLDFGVKILDGGPCQHGLESTIIDFTGTRPRCLRLGAIALEEIEKLTGRLEVAKTGEAVQAPGMSARHYAPRIPLQTVATAAELSPDSNTALLSIGPAAATGFAAVEVLSPTGDLTEAAAHLFQALHRLEKSGAKSIAALLAPERDLGRAINDRLRRASSPTP